MSAGGECSRTIAEGLSSFLARMKPHAPATADADHVPPSLCLKAGEQQLPATAGTRYQGLWVRQHLFDLDGLPLRESEEATAPTLSLHPAIRDTTISPKATVMAHGQRNLSPLLGAPILPRPAFGAGSEIFQKSIERLIDVVHGTHMVTQASPSAAAPSWVAEIVLT